MDAFRKLMGPLPFAVAMAALLGYVVADSRLLGDLARPAAAAEQPGGSAAAAAAAGVSLEADIAALRAELRTYFRATDQRLERIESYIDRGRRYEAD